MLTSISTASRPFGKFFSKDTRKSLTKSSFAARRTLSWLPPGKSKLRDSRDYGTFSILTPYLVPPELAEKKVVNIGDGFILRAIERFVGKQTSERIFTSRVAPKASEM